jgi:hypothetical protein
MFEHLPGVNIGTFGRIKPGLGQSSQSPSGLRLEYGVRSTQKGK